LPKQQLTQRQSWNTSSRHRNVQQFGIVKCNLLCLKHSAASLTLAVNCLSVCHTTRASTSCNACSSRLTLHAACSHSREAPSEQHNHEPKLQYDTLTAGNHYSKTMGKRVPSPSSRDTCMHLNPSCVTLGHSSSHEVIRVSPIAHWGVITI
jgi:hypothetical protein